jgi:HSP20 family protein
MSLMRFDPFSDLMSLREAMNRLLEEPFAGRAMGTMVTRGVPIDMYEKDDHIIVKAALPGAKPDDVDITISGDTLTIRANVLPELESKEVENWDWYRHELTHGQFMRSITLPTRVNADQANATFENGILTLQMPKSEEAKPKRVSIQGRSQEKQVQIGQSQPGSMQQGRA